jgi:hypothetical protein
VNTGIAKRAIAAVQLISQVTIIIVMGMILSMIGTSIYEIVATAH